MHAPKGELKENERGSRSSVSMVWSLGHAIFSENFISRPGSLASRSTKSKTTSPPARPSAVSTESVRRRLDDSLTARRSTTTSMVCLSFLSSVGGSSSVWVSPSTRARLKPCCWSWRKSSTYSPLRPRMTGASTWKRRPSSSARTRSTICCGVCRSIGAPQVGQWARPGARVEQAEVVVDLGDRADGGARVLRGRLLVDADRRAQALDEVDVGLVHLAEELAGVGRERLDVAALALGEDRVERQARLARPGQPGEDDERVAREVEGDVLEVVLPGAPDDELVGHSGPRSGIDGVEHMFVPERRRWQPDAAGQHSHAPPTAGPSSTRQGGP